MLDQQHCILALENSISPIKKTKSLRKVAGMATKQPKIPKFILLLTQMLENESEQILAWTVDGQAIEVKDISRLESEVFQHYFKHRKFTSFQRQLNYFGFTKYTIDKETGRCTFRHPYYSRFNTENIGRIKKKHSNPTAAAAAVKNEEEEETASPFEQDVQMLCEILHSSSTGTDEDLLHDVFMDVEAFNN